MTDDDALAAAEAEAAEAEALAAAAQARAKAIRLRRLAEESRAALAAPATEATETPATTATTETAEVPVGIVESESPAASVTDPAAIDSAGIVDIDEAEPPVDHGAVVDGRGWRRWIPGWRPVVAAVAVIALLALVAASGYLIWHHRQAVQRADRATAFSTGARQGVVNLMSLNFNTGKADLQRVMDSTTGPFHDDFEKSANDFLKVMADAKVVTTTTVSATAIESMTDNEAVVLVAATSQVANTASEQPNPRAWRLAVTVDKVDGQIKMSKVEFVP